MSTLATAESPFEASVSRKVLLAVTGLVMYGFITVHMIGNLQLYQGPEKLNHYADLLQSAKPLLWSFRCVLLLSVVTHAWISISLALKNRAARPVKYAGQRFVEADLASRTMIWSGPVIALFVVYHILHFTVGTAHPDFVPGDVYRNVVVGFRIPIVALVYVAAMVGLGFHIFHGATSLFQTLGIRTPGNEKKLKAVLTVVSAAIVAANVSFPLAVLSGAVKLPPHQEAGIAAARSAAAEAGAPAPAAAPAAAPGAGK